MHVTVRAMKPRQVGAGGRAESTGAAAPSKVPLTAEEEEAEGMSMPSVVMKMDIEGSEVCVSQHPCHFALHASLKLSDSSLSRVMIHSSPCSPACSLAACSASSTRPL